MDADDGMDGGYRQGARLEWDIGMPVTFELGGERRLTRVARVEADAVTGT